MKTLQHTFQLKPYPRGFHLIERDIEQNMPELRNIEAGIVHIFIHHTSAGLTLNENADPTVRGDFERHFNKMVPENMDYYQHTQEGPDDMPAHIKASLLGSSVSVPIQNGKLLTGTWQGVYLCEHRNHAGSRKITITIMGD
ncbi:secondary thiamine-phosphate synthase enzyme YjbQ [Marivirga arenosa]|uniref:Secondary thiamine-phosphate synthase enzyme YjbQ n=1 Tax=Marivirga arenosa TaxID=3059076 RepID=A0AA49J9X4_9BACT|nr:secondary thiamine-phosphate synthase enzyme YjbQ [Marivirga sp. ABR2-2]WKK83453.1 secondary thiamine-phosphate synthase enzyme YjbQ [Marivirga sp. ABR2-2]